MEATLKKKISVIIICAVLLIVCLAIHEVFLSLGNYIMTNYPGESEDFPLILVPFAPDGIIQNVLFMGVLFLLPYVFILIFGIKWLRKSVKENSKFYLCAAIFCAVSLVLYLFMRWSYVYRPLMNDGELYPYISPLQLIVELL